MTYQENGTAGIGDNNPPSPFDEAIALLVGWYEEAIAAEDPPYDQP